RLWYPTAVPGPKGCCIRQHADAVSSCSRPEGCCIRQHADAVSSCSRPEGCCIRQHADAVSSCSRPEGCCIRQHAGAVSSCSRPDAKAKGGQTLAVSWPPASNPTPQWPRQPYISRGILLISRPKISLRAKAWGSV